MTELRNVFITDPITGEQAAVEPNGGLAVNVQDQTSELVDLYMCRNTGTTTPTVSMSIDDRTVTVASTTGAVVGDCIDIKENGHLFQAVIQSIVGSVITFNAPSDKAFTTAAEVCFGEWNMNYDGSTTMLTYMVAPPAGVKWDVVRIIISITDSSEMDATTFGGMPALSNGVVLRYVDGTHKNIFIVNDNGGFAERAYDTSYDDRRSPQSDYGFRCRRTFGGQSKNGVVIRLDGDSGDELQFLIQDDLTPLDKLAVVVQGHVVEDN